MINHYDNAQVALEKLAGVNRLDFEDNVHVGLEKLGAGFFDGVKKLFTGKPKVAPIKPLTSMKAAPPIKPLVSMKAAPTKSAYELRHGKKRNTLIYGGKAITPPRDLSGRNQAPRWAQSQTQKLPTKSVSNPRRSRTIFRE
jgi:hypothetical protein